MTRPNEYFAECLQALEMNYLNIEATDYNSWENIQSFLKDVRYLEEQMDELWLNMEYPTWISNRRKCI